MARAKKQPAEGVTSYRSRTVRAELPHDAFFACDHPLVGTQLPGRRGGLVSGCATPSKARPHELQLWVGLPGVGKPVRASTARRRASGRVQFESRSQQTERREQTQLAVEAWREDGLPAPVGRVHPGRQGSSKCDAEHPLWSGYGEALEAAEERAAIATEGRDLSPKQWRVAVRDALELEAPALFGEWDKATRKCAEQYEQHAPRSRGYESPQAAAARRRAAWLVQGGDVGDAEYTDQLADSTKAKQKRARSSSSSRKKGGRRG